MTKEKIIIQLIEIENLLEIIKDKKEKIKLKKEWIRLNNKLNNEEVK